MILRFAIFSALFASSCSQCFSSVYINEFDYDNVGSDNQEWIELVGTAGTSLNAYELVFINGANNAIYNTFDLAPANFTFSDETASGWGFFVLGIVGSEYGSLPVADYTPATWTIDELQNGAPDSIQLRLKGTPPTNVHFIDYEGDDADTSEDQFIPATVADNNAEVGKSLYITGNFDSFFDVFVELEFEFGLGTPGALNNGQTLTDLSTGIVPEPASFLVWGGVGLLGLAMATLKKRAA